jgi:spore cortex formation protein SpoVR/YcgB (stage V sporulation)
MKTLTPELIREMYRDFGLDEEEERARLLELSRESSGAEEVHREVFFRTAASTEPELESADAQLGQHS